MGIAEDEITLLNHALKVFSKGFQGIVPSQITEVAIYHSPYHYIPEIIKKTKHITQILTIHDIIPLLYPDYCGITSESFYRFPKNFEFGLHSSLNSVDPDTWVSCPSQATRNAVIEHTVPERESAFILRNHSLH